MSSEVLFGVWMDTHISVEGVVHRGTWSETNGWWGESTARCGRKAFGYLTASGITCEECKKA